MSTERWNTANLLATPQDAVRLQACYLDVAEDAAGPGELQIINHDLGRIPRGIRIVNMALSTGSDCKWWRYDSDPAWTERVIYIRLNASNGRVLLEVF